MSTEVEIPNGFQANPNPSSHRNLPGNIAIENYSGIDDVDDGSDFSYAIGDRARAAAKKLKEAAERVARAAKLAAEKAAREAKALADKAEKAAATAAKKGTQAAKNAAQKAKNAADKAKNKAKSAANKAKTKLKKIKKPFARFNPYNVSSRAAALTAFRTNAFGVSSRLAPAFINDSNFKADAKAKVLPKWDKIKKFWVKLGGKTSALEAAIRKGYKIRPIKNLASKSGFKKTSSAEGDEMNIAADAEPTQEGIGIIGSIIQLLKGLLSPFKSVADAPEGFDDAVDDSEDFSEDEAIPEIGPDGEPMEDGEPIEKEEILGIPKTPFIIGSALLGTAIIVVIAAFAIKGGKKSQATS